MGENKSPQLSWTPVEGASCYAIYMIDTTASNWCHWIAKDVKVTELELGAELENSQYIGPYPPGGVHTYEVMIFALKNSPDSYEGYFDNSNPSLDKIIEALDTSGGTTGNPKCVVISHQAMVMTGMQIASWFSVILEKGKDIILLNMPLFHVYAQVNVLEK